MNQAADAISLLVGFSQGSASNIVAQIIAPALGNALGRAIHIVHLPGENGALAAEQLARAAADGNTLGITVQAQLIGSLLGDRRRYNPLQDFSPVALFARNPMVLAVSNSLNVHSVTDLIALARSQAEPLVYGASAIGGLPHLAAALFASRTGIPIRMRVYAETNDLYEDLHNGRIALTFNNTMSALPLAKAGKISILGVTSLIPSELAPGYPAIAQSALPDFEVMSWVGLWAPAGTPTAIVDRLNAAVTQTVQTAAIATALHDHGIEPVCETPGYFATHLRNELTRWAPFVARPE